LGPLSYSKGEEQVFLGREIAQHRDYSEKTAQRIDDEIARLIKNAHTKAKAVLEEHLDLLHALSEQLLEKETVLGKELDELIVALKPDIDLPKRSDDEPGQRPDAVKEQDSDMDDSGAENMEDRDDPTPNSE
ncbi:MAG: cell division protein FtsH, partial [Desulfobacteraceae bacterium]